jgi:hypothetical protein
VVPISPLFSTTIQVWVDVGPAKAKAQRFATVKAA